MPDAKGSTRATLRDQASSTAGIREESAVYDLRVHPDHPDAPTPEQAIRDVGFDPERSAVVDRETTWTRDGWLLTYTVWEVTD